MTEKLPIGAAKQIAAKYGYDQVIIVARKCGEGGIEHCTTYGVTKDYCVVAARIGEFFKHDLMEWPRDTKSLEESQARDAFLAEAVLRANGQGDSLDFNIALKKWDAAREKNLQEPKP